MAQESKFLFYFFCTESGAIRIKVIARMELYRCEKKGIFLHIHSCKRKLYDICFLYLPYGIMKAAKETGKEDET
ncbi:hypothetical protein DXA99_08165 [Eubacterium sp. OF10-16]|nr:hypothetical protein DWX37_02380 [Eubacterium sp. AF19-17]RJV97690.1 hypothetical protein DW840_09045 [Eubacterium sp. AM35-6AC]RJW47244.1 hypothetical protein DXA99_08165 [Eubacterium sp. OF10-16]